VSAENLYLSEDRVPCRVVTLDRYLERGSSLEECCRRPNFDFQWYSLARKQLFDMGMTMPRTQRRAARRVEIPVRGSEPAFGKTVAVVSVVPGKENLVPGRVKFAEDHEQVRIIACGRADPELQFNRILPISSTASSNRVAGWYRTLLSGVTGSLSIQGSSSRKDTAGLDAPMKVANSPHREPPAGSSLSEFPVPGALLAPRPYR
jgi:hypothetical protein